MQGSHIRLVRNENFNLGPLPAIDEVLVRIIPDLNSLSVAVASRQVHVTDGWLTLEQAAAMEEAPGVNAVFVPAMWLEHATLQVNHPPLDDKRVRQAILLAIDRDAINDALFKGNQPPAHSWVPDWHPGHNPDVAKYLYDPERAKALLAEAGYTADSDGMLVNADGEPLSIPITTIAGDRTREQVAALVQAQWQEIGITSEVQAVSGRLLFSTFLGGGELEGVSIWRWVFRPTLVQDARGKWYPGMGGATLDQLGPDSFWGQIERNKELIEMAEVELDTNKRLELLKEQQAIWAEELPVLPIYWHSRVATVDESVTGYDPADQADVFWNIETWDITQ